LIWPSNACIGAIIYIIYPGYVLQHLLRDTGKGGALFVSDGMVERVAIVAGDGYYEVRRENRQVKISPNLHSASTDPGQSHEVTEETSVQSSSRVVTPMCWGDGNPVRGWRGSLRAWA
jgi:hypothetical protein